MQISVTIEGERAWQGRSGSAAAPRRVVIGSGRRCDVVIESESVAPVHAELAIDDAGIWMCALSPVTIDGQVIVGWSHLHFRDPVAVRVGGREIVVGVVSDRTGGKPPPPSATAATVATPAARGQVAEDAIAATAAARLAEMFAMPAATKDAGRQTRPFRILKRRFLRLTINSWLVIMVSGAISAFVFVTREVPRATAGHGLRADFIPPSARAQRPALARKAGPLAAGTSALAAAALITGDFPKALSLYRRLGEEDSKFQPFVRGLEQRLKGQCSGDAAGRGGSCP